MIADSSIEELIPALEVAEVNPRASEVADLVAAFRGQPQVSMPVVHRFSDGIYLREIFMPAGTLVVGYVHKTRHLNVVLSGRALVQMRGRNHLIQAGEVFESEAGVQKVLFIEEDTRWQTIHANPDNCREITVLEERIVQLTGDELAAKGGLTLDQFRHSLANPVQNSLCP